MLSYREILDIVVMTIAVGFIFGKSFSKAKTIKKEGDDDYDPIEAARNQYEIAGVNLQGILFAMAVAAPAVILHEFGHKFMAMAFGYTATFHASYGGLAIGVLIRLMNLPFIILVPAFVRYSATPGFQTALVALAGPLMNFVLMATAFLILKLGNVDKKYFPLLILTMKINMWWGLFNLIPILPFDGGHVVRGLMAGFGL